MALFHVTVTQTAKIVVVAEDEDHAWQVARDEAQQAFDDDAEPVDVHVTGEIHHLRHLRAGWDGDCVPYGGDGNTRLRDMLPGNKEG